MECSLLPVTSGLLGVLLGGVIGFVGTWLNNKIFATRQAGAQLRAAFAPNLAYLRSTEGFTSDTEEIRGKLYESLISIHAAELEKFRFFIKSKDIKAYSEACEKYEILLHPGAMASAGEEQPSEFFIKHIHGLLSYVKT